MASTQDDATDSQWIRRMADDAESRGSSRQPSPAPFGTVENERKRVWPSDKLAKAKAEMEAMKKKMAETAEEENTDSSDEQMDVTVVEKDKADEEKRNGSGHYMMNDINAVLDGLTAAVPAEAAARGKKRTETAEEENADSSDEQMDVAPAETVAAAVPQSDVMEQEAAVVVKREELTDMEDGAQEEIRPRSPSLASSSLVSSVQIISRAPSVASFIVVLSSERPAANNLEENAQTQEETPYDRLVRQLNLVADSNLDVRAAIQAAAATLRGFTTPQTTKDEWKHLLGMWIKDEAERKEAEQAVDNEYLRQDMSPEEKSAAHCKLVRLVVTSRWHTEMRARRAVFASQQA